jgi:2-polyprenyl-3-methyl-5-hydroxy-6-metoxy-1,4-benzoquinol methylase
MEVRGNWAIPNSVAPAELGLATPRFETSCLRPCPLCGCRQFSNVFGAIRRCKCCRLCLINPLGTYPGENETKDYFLKSYLPVHLENLEGTLAERRAHIAAMKVYCPMPAHPRLLDVGCALGFMLHEAKLAGWEPEGIETSEFAARYAAQHTGCPVHAGTLETAGLERESFDVVTLMDVIEHVAEPRKLIREIHQILRPGGILFIVTPNFGSLFVKLYGPRAYGVGPDHVVYFEPSTMSRLLCEVGFKRIVTGSKDFYAANMRRLLHRDGGAESGDIKATFSAHKPLRKVRKLVNHFLMRVPVGDKLIAFAQK